MERFRPFQQITIKEQPQPFVFPGEWFEIVLSPLMEEGGATTPKSILDFDDLTLQTSLHLNSGRTPLSETSGSNQNDLVRLIFRLYFSSSAPTFGIILT
jgi:hypothetical protein